MRPPEPRPPSPGSEESITAWLQAWTSGDTEAGERLFALVYPELKKLARRFLARERAGIPLGTTELVHETFLRLVAQRQDHWQNRDQLFALASTLARRILVDQAKHGRRRKRGGGWSTSPSRRAFFPASPRMWTCWPWTTPCVLRQWRFARAWLARKLGGSR